MGDGYLAQAPLSKHHEHRGLQSSISALSAVDHVRLVIAQCEMQEACSKKSPVTKHYVKSKPRFTFVDGSLGDPSMTCDNTVTTVGPPQEAGCHRSDPRDQSLVDQNGQLP